MIRFSAALVAVAIGVLIGGIATSKLVLVYIAIAASAVALLALAIGVMLKRKELFGEGQGLATAQAGASAELTAQAGERRGQVPNGLVPPPPSQGAAVGPGAAFAERPPAAAAQQGVSWAGSAAPDAWPSPAAATAAVPAMWQSPPVPAGATVSGWGAPAVSEPAATGDPEDGATSVSAWGTSAPSVFAPHSADAPAASPEAGAEPGSPNWFNPAGRPASAGKAAPGSGNGWSWPNGDSAVPADAVPAGAVPADAGPADNEEPVDGAAPADEDWPTRYSWLDDEPEEPEADAESGEDKPAGPVAATVSEPALAGDATLPADVVAPAATESGEDADADPVVSPATLRLVRDPGPDPAAATAQTAAATVATEVVETAESTEAAAVPGERETELPAAEPTGTEPPRTGPGDQSPAAGLVSVIRGVPRFHQEDCVLIRFMPGGDTQKLPAAEAREAGCTPCAACQPEG